LAEAEAEAVTATIQFFLLSHQQVAALAGLIPLALGLLAALAAVVPATMATLSAEELALLAKATLVATQDLEVVFFGVAVAEAAVPAPQVNPYLQLLEEMVELV
jgi:predicted ABC-type sugar transport system permease subunit